MGIPAGTDAKLIITPELSEALPLIELLDKAEISVDYTESAIAQFDAIAEPEFVGILDSEVEN